MSTGRELCRTGILGFLAGNNSTGYGKIDGEERRPSYGCRGKGGEGGERSVEVVVVESREVQQSP